MNDYTRPADWQPTPIFDAVADDAAAYRGPFGRFALAPPTPAEPVSAPQAAPAPDPAPVTPAPAPQAVTEAISLPADDARPTPTRQADRPAVPHRRDRGGRAAERRSPTT